MGNPNLKSVSRFISDLSVKLIAIIIVIITIICLPFNLILISPILIFRVIVRHCANHFRPDLGKMLTPFSALFTASNIYSAQPFANLVVCYVVSGKIEIDEFRKAVNLRLIHLTREENGEAKYPELRQSVFNWMGFAFWKWDKNFDIKNHIHLEYQDKETVTKEMNQQLQYKLANKPYAPNRSPWELILVQNYVDSEYDDECPGPKSVIHLRFQHCLCDGFSMLKAMFESVGDQEQLKILKHQTQLPPSNSNCSPMSLIYKIGRFLKMPYDFFYTNCQAMSIQPFGKVPPEYKNSNEFYYKYSSRIRSDFVKKIKNGHNVQFTSVLLAAVTAGVRKALELRNLPIPEFMNIDMPFPQPGHPDKLSIWATMGRIKLPLGETDSKERLLKVNEAYLFSKRSLFSTLLFYIGRVGGSLFQFILKMGHTNKIGVLSFLDFPGPHKPLGFREYNLLSMTFMESFMPGNMSLTFAMITCVDRFRILVTCHKGFYTEQSKLDEVMEAVLQEMDILNELLI